MFIIYYFYYIMQTTSLLQDKKVIVITLNNWEIYYKAYSKEAYKAYIEQWNNRKPVEIDHENRVTGKDIKQIKAQMLDNVLWFISTQTLNKEEMLKVYKDRIKMNRTRTSLKMFLDALQTRWIQIEQIQDEETTNDQLSQ